MNRRVFLRDCGLLLGGMAVSRPLMGLSASSQPVKRPDVLLICLEDVSPQRFGCWGGPCLTPNIDQLAASGVRFDLAHTNCPPCNPSRTTLLTGIRPETHQVFSNQQDWREVMPNRVTLPQHFRENGYETVRIGKIFHGAYEHKPSWSRELKERNNPALQPQSRSIKGAGADLIGMSKEEMKAARAEGDELGKGGSPFAWGSSGKDETQDRDWQAAEQAIQLLQEEHDQPLFLAVGFHKCHLPFIVPQKYLDMYPPEKIQLPKNASHEDPKSNPDHRTLTDETWREAIAAHYACLTFADDLVGRILKALDETGRRENTIVVLWSDHGFMLGEHYEWRKSQLFEIGVRSALLISVPGITKPGSVCTRPVESVDILPTIADLCGLPMLDGIEAISMKPLLENPSIAWKKGAITYSHGLKNRSIRTERYRYSEYDKGHAQLFDYETDPLEHRNLAGDPAHTQTVEELAGLLKAGWKSCLPPKV